MEETPPSPIDSPSSPEANGAGDFVVHSEGEMPEEAKEVASGDAGGTPTHKLPQGEADHPGMDDHFEDIAKHHVVEVAGDDSVGRKLVVFYCSRLPPSNTYSQDRLLGFMKFTLDQYVESDYSLVIFWYGLTKQNRPSFKWLVQAYNELERKYKKNLKALYLVHPSNTVKLLWGIFKHIVSSKFVKKVHYITFISDLIAELRTDRIEIPQIVKEHDDREILRRKRTEPTSFYAPSSPPPPTQQFGVSLQLSSEGAQQPAPAAPETTLDTTTPTPSLKEKNKGHPLPRVVRETVEYLSKNGLDKEGIFRRCPKAETVKEVQNIYNSGGIVDYSLYPDTHTHALILKTFFRELPEPIMTFDLYDIIINVKELKDEEERIIACKELVCNKLPIENYVVLRHAMQLLNKVAQNHTENKMTAQNLAIVFGPNLVWSRDATALHSLASLGSVNAFAQTLISGYDQIFIKEVEIADPPTDELAPSGVVGGAGEQNGMVSDGPRDGLPPPEGQSAGVQSPPESEGGEVPTVKTKDIQQLGEGEKQNEKLSDGLGNFVDVGT